MPETFFRYQLAENAEIVVQMVSHKGEVETYSVVLLAFEDGEWHTVRVYDNHLGEPHMHRYDRSGVKGPAAKAASETAHDGYNMALDDVKHGFEEMIQAWHRS